MSCIKILTTLTNNLGSAPDFKDPVSARLLLSMKQLCFYNVHVYLKYIYCCSIKGLVSFFGRVIMPRLCSHP